MLERLRPYQKSRYAGGLIMSRKIKRTPQAALSIKGAFDEFVVAQTAKGFSESTIKNYHSHFHSISKHFDIEKPFAELTQTDIHLLFFSSLASLRKPAQIRPHGPDRCLFPLFPAKPHTAAHRGKQGGSCASYPVPAFRGDNLTAWLSLVILRLFDIFPTI